MHYTVPAGVSVAVGDRFRLSAGTIAYLADEIVPHPAHSTGQVMARHPRGRRVRIPLDATLVRLEAAQ